MSVKHIGEVFDLDLPRADFIILIVLADSADSEGENSWASVPYLSYLTGYDGDEVQYNLDSLIKQGVLSIDTSEESRGDATCYSLHFGAASKKLPFTEWVRRRNASLKK